MATDPTNVQRDTILLSHANPEDNEFTLWLLRRSNSESRQRHDRIDDLRPCPNCGNEEYQLVTNSSPFFSDWRFQCTNYLSGKEVVQADRETLALLKPGMDASLGNLSKEWNSVWKIVETFL